MEKQHLRKIYSSVLVLVLYHFEAWKILFESTFFIVKYFRLHLTLHDFTPGKPRDLLELQGRWLGKSTTRLLLHVENVRMLAFTLPPLETGYMMWSNSGRKYLGKHTMWTFFSWKPHNLKNKKEMQLNILVTPTSDLWHLPVQWWMNLNTVFHRTCFGTITESVRRGVQNCTQPPSHRSSPTGDCGNWDRNSFPFLLDRVECGTALMVFTGLARPGPVCPFTSEAGM